MRAHGTQDVLQQPAGMFDAWLRLVTSSVGAVCKAGYLITCTCSTVDTTRHADTLQATLVACQAWNVLILICYHLRSFYLAPKIDDEEMEDGNE